MHLTVARKRIVRKDHEFVIGSVPSASLNPKIRKPIADLNSTASRANAKMKSPISPLPTLNVEPPAEELEIISVVPENRTVSVVDEEKQAEKGESRGSQDRAFVEETTEYNIDDYRRQRMEELAAVTRSMLPRYSMQRRHIMSQLMAQHRG